MKRCSTFLIYNEVHYHIPPVVILPKMERETNRDDRCTKKMHISEKGYIKREEEEDLKKKNILDGLAIRLLSLM